MTTPITEHSNEDRTASRPENAPVDLGTYFMGLKGRTISYELRNNRNHQKDEIDDVIAGHGAIFLRIKTGYGTFRHINVNDIVTFSLPQTDMEPRLPRVPD